jgi:hypothetical protein
VHYDDFLIKLDHQLQQCNCKVWRKPRISDHREVDIFATRIHWKVARIPVHLFVTYISDPKPDDFTALFQEGLHYGRRAYSSDMMGLKLVMSSLAIVPCIVSDRISAETVHYVTTRQKLPVAGFRAHGLDYLPVLHHLQDNRTYHWTGKEVQGTITCARKFLEDSLLAICDRARDKSNQSSPNPCPAKPIADNANWWEGQNPA